MKITGIRDTASDELISDCREAEHYAAMMDELMLDIDDLDPVACPPDRRFLLRDREAWIYEHGNICELVFVRA
jgi:hypothetical protein